MTGPLELPHRPAPDRPPSIWHVPALIPRPVLTLKYGLFALLGFTLWATGSPSLTLVAGDLGSLVIGSVLTIAGATAFVGSCSARRPFRHLELWGTIVVAACLLGYAAAPIELLLTGDTGRLQLSLFALVAAVLPAGRAWHLIEAVGGRGGRD